MIIMRNNLASLQGTPCHITYLKSDEKGRRDRRACKYYVKYNQCAKGMTCYGGRFCKEYERKNKKQKNSSETRIEGTFIVKFYDEPFPIKYEIGRNINENAPIIKAILDLPIHSEFEVNGEKGFIIDKNFNIIE